VGRIPDLPLNFFIGVSGADLLPCPGRGSMMTSVKLRAKSSVELLDDPVSTASSFLLVLDTPPSAGSTFRILLVGVFESQFKGTF